MKVEREREKWDNGEGGGEIEKVIMRREEEEGWKFQSGCSTPSSSKGFKERKAKERKVKERKTNKK